VNFGKQFPKQRFSSNLFNNGKKKNIYIGVQELSIWENGEEDLEMDKE
jgi:hypothetical protein